MIFALAGNQNCGKTTLFNQLTGSNQHVGNFPGVTVERKEGVVTRAGRRAIPRLWHRMRQDERHRAFHEAARDNALREARDAMREAHEDRRRLGEIRVVDLPGIYSLSPYTNEEIVTRDFLLDSHPDGIINIVDATNIERNLYLTLQLIELHIPMVDGAQYDGRGPRERRHDQDQKALGGAGGSRSCRSRRSKTRASTSSSTRRPRPPPRGSFPRGSTSARARCTAAIHAVAHLVEDHAERIGVPPRFAATKLVEGDAPMMERLALSENEKEHGRAQRHRDGTGAGHRPGGGARRHALLLHRTIWCATAVVKPGESREHVRSVRMDAVLTHKYFAIPIFLVIMLLIFWLTFGVIGSFLSDLLSTGIDAVTASVSSALGAYGLNPVVHSLVIDGVFAGVGQRALLPADHRRALLLPLDARGQRLYGARRLRHGQAAAQDRSFRPLASCRCSSASAARCPPSWRPAPSRASGTAE